MAKKIDLGVSRGPNEAERKTIAAGNKKVEVNYTPDHEKEPEDPHVTERLSRANKTRTIQREIDETHALPGGRNNPIHTTVPGMDSADAQHKSLAKHSADFIAASARGNRAGMEAARSAFHAVRASAKSMPQGVEGVCSTPGCAKTTKNAATTCGDGGCGAGPNVQRPRG